VYELLKKSFLESPVIERNGYPYFINPMSDGIPTVEPALLKEVIDGMIEIGNFECDIILAPEAMGIPLVVALSLRLGIPYSIIRKRRYGIPEEIEVHRDTGYSSGNVYVNGLKKDDRVVIVDDTLSTGGTMRALVSSLTSRGIEIVDILVVFDKTENISTTVQGMNVKALLNVSIKDGRPWVNY
jgi:adenine phosphoribosyltransferase